MRVISICMHQFKQDNNRLIYHIFSIFTNIIFKNLQWHQHLVLLGIYPLVIPEIEIIECIEWSDRHFYEHKHLNITQTFLYYTAKEFFIISMK